MGCRPCAAACCSPTAVHISQPPAKFEQVQNACKLWRLWAGAATASRLTYSSCCVWVDELRLARVKASIVVGVKHPQVRCCKLREWVGQVALSSAKCQLPLLAESAGASAQSCRLYIYLYLFCDLRPERPQQRRRCGGAAALLAQEPSGARWLVLCGSLQDEPQVRTNQGANPCMPRLWLVYVVSSELNRSVRWRLVRRCLWWGPRAAARRR